MMECMNLSALLVCAMSQVLDPAPAPIASPPTPVVYEWIGLDGSIRQGALISIDKGSVRIRESRGGESTIPLAGIASAWRISAAGRAPAAPLPEGVDGEEVPVATIPIVWTLQFTDGQRLRGDVVEPSATDSLTLALSSRTLAQEATTNAVTVPLERLSRAWSGHQWPRSAQRTSGDYSRDVLWLSNGDVISGFVSDIGKVIKIEPQGSSGGTPVSSNTKVQEIPLAAIAALSLTNPDVSASGFLAGWEDGSITTLSSLTVREHACRAVLAVASEVVLQYFLDSLSFLVPDASRWRSLRADGVGPSGALMSNSDGVLMAEPGTYSWTVKPGETHFVAQVALPASCFDWGDCTLIVRVLVNKSSASQESARVHIDAESPQHQLNIALAGNAAAIEFTIDPGPSGPVQDRLQFSRAGFITSPRK